MSEDSALDMLFDHYIPLLSRTGLRIGTATFEINCSLIDLLSDIVINYGSGLARRAQMIVDVFDVLMANMNLSQDPSCQVHMFRVLIDTYTRSISFLSKENQSVFLLLLLQNSPKGSVIRPIALRFITDNIPEGFNWSTLAKMIRMQSVRDHEDLLFLEKIILHKDNTCRAEELRLVMKAAVTNPVLRKAATFFTATTLINMGTDQSTKDLIDDYVLRCYCYLYFSHKQNHVTMTCECVSDFLEEMGRYNLEPFTKSRDACALTFQKLKLAKSGMFPIFKSASKGKIINDALKTILTSTDPMSVKLSEIFKGETLIRKPVVHRKHVTSRSEPPLVSFQ